VPGFGTEKKTLIIQIIKVIWPKLQEFVRELQPIKWEVMEGIIGQIIDLVVGFLNTVGVFKHELKGEKTLQSVENVA